MADTLRIIKSCLAFLHALENPIVTSIIVSLVAGGLCYGFLRFLNYYKPDAGSPPTINIQQTSSGSDLALRIRIP